MKNHCSVVRALCHTQVRKIPSLMQKKGHLFEVQINGGSIANKVEFGRALFEKAIPIDSIFQANEMIDVINITRGKGTKGVISRSGVTRLPRKTHRGLRKVACVGAWHPSAVKWTVARAGQTGFNHRTEMHKKIYRIAKACDNSHTATTEHDMTDKGITPMGGYPHYGIVRNDYIILKGSVPGPVRRAVTIRPSLFPQTHQSSLEQISLKFIDTSSKMGHGRFQTSGEKIRVLGTTKHSLG